LVLLLLSLLRVDLCQNRLGGQVMRPAELKGECDVAIGFWTDEKVERLALLWADKTLSNQMIGDDLGCSRGAASSKAKHLKLGPRPRDAADQTTIKPKKANSEAIPTRWSKERGGIPFLSLRPGQCKWPCADLHETAEQFCGRPVEDGLPYCRTHAAHAYRSRAHHLLEAA
jgi:GcrA cell cycle regulator